MLYNLMKFIILIFLQIATVEASNQCFINDILKDPQINSDQNFWKRYDQLLTEGQSHEKALELSYLEHTKKKAQDQKQSQSSENRNNQGRDRTPTIDISKKGQLEIDRLAPQLKKKVDEFLDLVATPNGLREIRNNPGRWHFEELNYKPDMYTVRLNGGYRILFEYKNEILSIKEVNKGNIHSK